MVKMYQIMYKVKVMQNLELILNHKKLQYIVLVFVLMENLYQVRSDILVFYNIIYIVRFKSYLYISLLGSPFSCKVVGAGQAVITGNNLKMGAVKRLISFTVDPQAPSTNCDVIVTPPSNVALPITIEPIDGKYSVSFVPTEVGRHNISILVDGEPIKGSPFACNIYDVTKVNLKLYNIL